jgi:hypothetical protein
VIWLLVVASAFGLLAFKEMEPTRFGVPGMEQADRLALPLLLVVVIAGMIRYFASRDGAQWNEVSPVLWLLAVGGGYGLLAFTSGGPTQREVPGMGLTDRLALPLLVVVVTAGIIRYGCARDAGQQSGHSSSELGAERRETE